MVRGLSVPEPKPGPHRLPRNNAVGRNFTFLKSFLSAVINGA